MKGIIKFYKQKEGFGFIAADNGQDCFFHIKDCKFSPAVGDIVAFDVSVGPKSLIASNIKLEVRERIEKVIKVQHSYKLDA